MQRFSTAPRAARRVRIASSPLVWAPAAIRAPGELVELGDLVELDKLVELGKPVEHARAAGQAVELIEHGPRRQLSDCAEPACCRVVRQELADAMKHAPGRRTSISIRYGERCMEIDVTTDGPDGFVPAAAAPSPSTRREPTGLTLIPSRPVQESSR